MSGKIAFSRLRCCNHRDAILPTLRALQHLARIENILGIEGALERAHQLDRAWILHLGQEIALEHADAVLGGDGAAELRYDLNHGGVDLMPALEEGGLIRSNRLHHVVMDIAVTEMSKGYRTSAWNERRDGHIGPAQKGRHCRDRHGDVMLDGATFVALHFAEHLTDAPEHFRLIETAGDGRVDDQSALEPFRQNFLQHSAYSRARLRRELDQHVPGMHVWQWIAAACAVLEHQLHPHAQHQLEARDIPAAALGRKSKEIE